MIPKILYLHDVKFSRKIHLSRVCFLKDTPMRFIYFRWGSVCRPVWRVLFICFCFMIIGAILKPNYKQTFQWLKFCFQAKNLKWNANICLLKCCVRTCVFVSMYLPTPLITYLRSTINKYSDQCSCTSNKPNVIPYSDHTS